jgi:hypothetical protein
MILQGRRLAKPNESRESLGVRPDAFHAARASSGPLVETQNTAKHAIAKSPAKKNAAPGT